VIGWKLWKKTKYHHRKDADLTLGGAVKEIEDYEDLVQHAPAGWVEKLFSGVWEWRDLWPGK
jgi:amino acid transporter